MVFVNGSEIILTRDPRKILATKQFYNKKNAHILNNPHLHRLAILQGLEAEQLSHLLEDCLRINVSVRKEELSPVDL